MKIGLDAIAAYVPRLSIDLCGEWAQIRAAELGEPSVENLIGKLKTGVGVVEMAVPDAHEDSATMAAEAAVSVIKRAGINPRDIGFLAVGTETTVDQSKSIAAYVLGMLESYFETDLSECGAPQFQFACIGATYALQAAHQMFRARENTKPYALVIATDISRYPLRTSGEYTQGAGAVAMLVCENPRLLELEPAVASTITRSERDFFRPNGLTTAVVDGKYSIGVYLDCMQKAADLFERRAGHAFSRAGERLDQLIDHFLFHVPFPRMAEYAAARIMGQSWRRSPELARELSETVPSITTDLSAPAALKAFERQLMLAPFFKSFMQKEIEPTLTYPRQIGNIYSGSMYLALISLLETHTDPTRLNGGRIGFFSYGSGASATVFSAKMIDASAHVPHLKQSLLSTGEGGLRTQLTMADYERLSAGPEDNGELLSLRQPAASVGRKTESFALVRIGHTPLDQGYRYYDYVR